MNNSELNNMRMHQHSYIKTYFNYGGDVSNISEMIKTTDIPKEWFVRQHKVYSGICIPLPDDMIIKESMFREKININKLQAFYKEERDCFQHRRNFKDNTVPHVFLIISLKGKWVLSYANAVKNLTLEERNDRVASMSSRKDLFCELTDEYEIEHSEIINNDCEEMLEHLKRHKPKLSFVDKLNYEHVRIICKNYSETVRDYKVGE